MLSTKARKTEGESRGLLAARHMRLALLAGTMALVL